MINQIYGLFEFNRENGSITQYSERPSPTKDLKQSQNNKQKCKPVRTENSIQTMSSPNSIKPSKRSKDTTLLIPTMDKVNGIDMNFILKKEDIFPRQTGYVKGKIASQSPTKPKPRGKAVKMKGYKSIVLPKVEKNKSKG